MVLLFFSTSSLTSAGDPPPKPPKSNNAAPIVDASRTKFSNLYDFSRVMTATLDVILKLSLVNIKKRKETIIKIAPTVFWPMRIRTPDTIYITPIPWMSNLFV